MTTRPATDESNAYYARYIALVPDGDLLAILAQSSIELSALMYDYSPSHMQYRPAPGEWSALEIVGHLTDTERILAYRALRIARGDSTPLEGVEDFAAYVTAADFTNRTLDDVVREYFGVRQETLALLRSFDAAAMARRGRADDNEISVRALAYIIAGHDLHHLADLRRYHAATSKGVDLIRESVPIESPESPSSGGKEVVLHLDEATANDLDQLLYNLGELRAAGVPIHPPSDDVDDRLGKVYRDILRQLGQPTMAEAMQASIDRKARERGW